MAFGKKKPSQSEIDGVQYRRVPTWCIAIAEMQGGAAMAFYSLVGLMSYVASEGYGIALAVAGVILTAGSTASSTRSWPYGSTNCTPGSASCAS